MSEAARRRLRPGQFTWSLVDQGLSSLTTFSFTVVGARSLGPAGLGTVALGYAIFLIALGLERAVIVEPLLARISTSARTALDAFRGAMSATIAVGSALTLVAVAIGLVLSGPGAQGALVFAPWFVPALSQSLVRSWLYREGRAVVATLSTATWLGTMSLAFVLGLRTSGWQITAAWGLGACTGLMVAALGTPGVGFASPRSALSWGVHEAAILGSWRAASTVLYSAASYARVAGLSAILGPAAVGGYRAIETIFAPASFVGPALANPGLPRLREAVERRAEDAWSSALKITAASVVLVSAYVVAVALGRDVVFRLYGAEFEEFGELIPPIAVGQVVASLGLGFGMLLLAARRMRELTLLIVVGSGLSLLFALPLAARVGLEAAAWGIALAELPVLLLSIVFARRLVPEGRLRTARAG